MKRVKLFMLFFALSCVAAAQNVDQYLISSFGGGVDVLQWSGCEPVISTNSSSENVITQGFQQTLLTVTAIEEQSSAQSDFIVYPNPFRSSLHIQQLSVDVSPLTFNITDLNGKLVLSESLNASEGEYNLENLAGGVYFLNVMQKDFSFKTFKVIKQN